VAIVSEQGLMAGAMTMFRLFILAASALLFTLTTESDMIHALSLLKIPDEIAFMSLIALRFLPDYVKEFRLCLESFELRGVNIKESSLRQKAMMMQTFVTPVLIRSLLKAKRLAMSMELRGFNAQPTRTSLHELSLTRRDKVVLGLSLCMGLLLMIGEQYL
jgi:energy-coupling factor transport system permease protein